jgi:hypothetical protein
MQSISEEKLNEWQLLFEKRERNNVTIVSVQQYALLNAYDHKKL